jgi:hypothetical protein
MSVYQTRRSALLAALVAEGWGDAEAAGAIREWEFEANRLDVDQRTEAFWRAGHSWITNRERTGGQQHPAGDEDSSGFDWRSPRWREAEQGGPESERARRMQDRPSPPQTGALDRQDSVERSR